jgi:hypothetical protein
MKPIRWCVLALLSTFVPVDSFAQPVAPVLITPAASVVGTTIAFTWHPAPTATWYHFWLGHADASLVMEQWYTAEHAGCAGGGTCTIVVTPPITAGPFIWYIQAWSPAGYGPWSAPHAFAVRDVVQAWSGKLPPLRRFTLVLDDHGVLDNETGLVWQRQVAATTRTAIGSMFYCGNHEAGNRAGWRNPTAAELKSLVAVDRTNPSLPLGHPFEIPGYVNFFWTTTRLDDEYAVVRFTDGAMGTATGTAGTVSSWCVRGGTGH